MNYFTMLVTFLGGIGLFLSGVSLMSSGLQKVAGNKMRKILEMLTKNKLVSIGVGTLVTAVIQSSAATTVMVIGFINAGLLNLSQSVGIIMGANIGTTVTGWIVSASSWGAFMQPDIMGPIAIAIGAITGIFVSKGAIKSISEIVVGFGMLFMGIGLMKTGAEPLSQLEMFKDMFVELGQNPILGILAGALSTAIIQSSSASVGILQSLAVTGAVTLNSSVYILMGMNIGTCVTSLISSVGANRSAKAAACVHLLFNVIGSLIFSLIAYFYFMFFDGSLHLAQLVVTETVIAVVHTGFNVLNTVLFYPFSGILVKLAEIMTAKFKDDKYDTNLVHLDDRLLKTPPIAIENCVKEIVRMGKISLENLTLACDALFDHDKEKIESVDSHESGIDMLQTAITKYMVKLCNSKSISSEENKVVTALFHTVNDMERIGDYSENVVESAQFMIKEGLEFNEVQIHELRKMCDKSIDCVTHALNALEHNDYPSVEKTIKEEQTLDDLEARYRKRHIERLAANDVDPTTGVSYLDTLTNLERVGDHALNVAQVVMKRFL